MRNTASRFTKRVKQEQAQSVVEAVVPWKGPALAGADGASVHSKLKCLLVLLPENQLRRPGARPYGAHTAAPVLFPAFAAVAVGARATLRRTYGPTALARLQAPRVHGHRRVFVGRAGLPVSARGTTVSTPDARRTVCAAVSQRMPHREGNTEALTVTRQTALLHAGKYGKPDTQACQSSDGCDFRCQDPKYQYVSIAYGKRRHHAALRPSQRRHRTITALVGELLSAACPAAPAAYLTAPAAPAHPATCPPPAARRPSVSPHLLRRMLE
ncbi:hypothetical protein GGX14DRAFT_575954 [Mycena pura]|uniref:Uncharacterized protein n=1 Tax=Mycena pura TaxID=153505 RepID=A0AAD6UW54_9AGAR|nr:hypothetical protein GGX14DRAFT_575954 [Mycena pura]